MTLVGCAFNEVHGVTRYGENHNFGDNLWDPGYICDNISYSLPDLESVDSRWGGGHPNFLYWMEKYSS